MTTTTWAKSERAQKARALVESLQSRFVAGLQTLAADRGAPGEFLPVSWQRDGGRHGGGTRFVAVDTPVFNRAAVNVSNVHYDDLPDRKLSSATALSTIIHPQSARAPSVHIHISWTELRDSTGYWRVMGDLNPAIEDPSATARFADIMRQAAPELYDQAAAQGDRYFFIPALERHRGVTHYYLEQYVGDDPDEDRAFARRFGEAVIDGYLAILRAALEDGDARGEVTADERSRQLAYHTLYFFQVLTLDRGTTSGLLVHDQNDVGILGSLPARIDANLLASWAERVPPPQDQLVRALAAAVPAGAVSEITDDVRAELARAVRDHYRSHPEALELQARGDVVPPTVDNHRGRP